MSQARVSLRWLLVAVTVLAAALVIMSLAALGRLVSMSTEQRNDRSRDVIRQELRRLADEPDPTVAVATPTIVGIRAGVATRQQGELTHTGLTRDTERALSTLAMTVSEGPAAAGELDVDNGTAFFGAQRRHDDRVVWAAITQPTSRYLPYWRNAVWLLTATTFLLGVVTILAVNGTTRGARALGRALGQLENDLDATVPRPGIAELADVADGVANLARSLKEAQRERERLTNELAHQQRASALGRVVAGVAHEVRNPLASMKLLVDNARETPGVPGVVASDLHDLSDEIERLDRLLMDFLVVSGRRIGPRRPGEIAEVAQKRAALLSPWAAERGVVVKVEGHATADIDEDSYARAVDNLMKNAIEASKPGATVRVIASKQGDVAALTVEDDGPGVPEDRAAELFEPFFTTKPEGTGLGLAVSRAIAVANGGQLSYRRDGGVTHFTLTVGVEA